MEVNEKIIKITGSACIENELENGHDYTIAAELQCFSEEKRDNQNGTFDKVFKLRMLGEVYLTDKGKSLIKGKSKKESSPSQRLYFVLRRYWEQNHRNEADFEIFYEQKINEYIFEIESKLEG